MERPAKCITVEKAKELQDNWTNSRTVAIEQALGYSDTREFNFTVAELQEYLDYVKEKSLEQGVNDPGIRIYFGAYQTSLSTKNYSTVFLAPTKGNSNAMASNEEGEDDNNYDIDPLNDAAGGVPPTVYNP